MIISPLIIFTLSVLISLQGLISLKFFHLFYLWCNYWGRSGWGLLLFTTQPECGYRTVNPVLSCEVISPITRSDGWGGPWRIRWVPSESAERNPSNSSPCSRQQLTAGAEIVHSPIWPMIISVPGIYIRKPECRLFHMKSNGRNTLPFGFWRTWYP